MVDEFFWDNVRSFTQTNMVTLLILAGVIGGALLIFTIVLICTVKNRQKIYEYKRKQHSNSRANHTLQQNRVYKHRTNSLEAISNGNPATSASNLLSASSAVTNDITNPEMQSLPSNSPPAYHKITSEISLFENFEDEEGCEAGAEEENDNEVSMVSWFDDTYGTLYRKHRLGSQRPKIEEHETIDM